MPTDKNKRETKFNAVLRFFVPSVLTMSSPKMMSGRVSQKQDYFHSGISNYFKNKSDALAYIL